MICTPYPLVDPILTKISPRIWAISDSADGERSGCVGTKGLRRCCSTSDLVSQSVSFAVGVAFDLNQLDWHVVHLEPSSTSVNAF